MLTLLSDGRLTSSWQNSPDAARIEAMLHFYNVSQSTAVQTVRNKTKPIKIWCSAAHEPALASNQQSVTNCSAQLSDTAMVPHYLKNDVRMVWHSAALAQAPPQLAKRCTPPEPYLAALAYKELSNTHISIRASHAAAMIVHTTIYCYCYCTQSYKRERAQCPTTDAVA